MWVKSSYSIGGKSWEDIVITVIEIAADIIIIVDTIIIVVLATVVLVTAALEIVVLEIVVADVIG